MMTRTQAFVALAATGLLASPTFAQDVRDAQSTTPSGARRLLNEETWSAAGSYEWKRPDNVRFILVRACGGGGGGGGGHSFDTRAGADRKRGTAAGGGGGAGADVSTILLGPLTATSYAVVIGRGGRGAASVVGKSKGYADTPGENGAVTSFTGPDLSFETPGAVGGRSATARMDMSVDQANAYAEFISSAESTGGLHPGGGSAQNGHRGLLALGGDGNVRGDSGGGGGSLGKGGAGGDVNSGGANGGACAGGGGAGYLQKSGDSSVGGRGGDGSLMLISMGTS